MHARLPIAKVGPWQLPQSGVLSAEFQLVSVAGLEQFQIGFVVAIEAVVVASWLPWCITMFGCSFGMMRFWLVSKRSGGGLPFS